MKITDIFKPKKAKPSYKSLKEAGFGLVSTAQSRIFSTDKKIPEEPLKPFKKYTVAYTGIPMVAAAIDRTVDFVVSPGFYIDSESSRAQKTLERFTEEMDFDIFLRNIVKDMLIYGDSFVEIVGKKNRVDELKVLNPEYMRVIRTKTNDIVGYFQDLPTAKRTNENPWKPDQIAHFIHNKVGDNPYGISVIDPLLKILEIKVKMENSMAIILERKANAPYHVKLGDSKEGFPATQEDIDSFTNELQALTNQTNWVTTDICDIKAIGIEGKVLDIEPYTQHIDNQMVYGLQVPYVLLGKGDISEGLASVQLEAMDRRAKSIQDLISKQIESKIFNRVIGSSGVKNQKVFLKWGEPSKVTETTELSTYLEMMKVDFSPEFKQELENEIRKIIGIKGKAPKPDEDGWPYQSYMKGKAGRPYNGGMSKDADRRKEINVPGTKKTA